MAGRIDTSKNKWWEAGKHLPNLHEIHDTPDFLAALGNAGDKLVIVDFYAQWCVVLGVLGGTCGARLFRTRVGRFSQNLLSGGPLSKTIPDGGFKRSMRAVPPRYVCERRRSYHI